MHKSLAFLLIVHLLLFIAIGFDIPVFRQIVAFLYLSFVPGLVLFRTLRLRAPSSVDTILLSVGLSIGFLMFVGLLTNELLFALGVLQPLSGIPLLAVLSLLTFFIFFVGNRQDFSEESGLTKGKLIGMGASVGRVAILVAPIFLAVIGALYGNLPILLLNVIVISVLYGLSLLSRRIIPSELHGVLIFVVSMALAFQLLLTSRYILGADAQLEYYVFKMTSINGHWRVFPFNIISMGTTNFNSMLSITVLPAVYSALTNLEGGIIFKVLYPFVFSLVPVALYRICEPQIGTSASLMSALFFVAGQFTFYGIEPLSLNRQIVAMFFMVLSIIVWFNKQMSVGKRRLLLIFFGTALVVSHYSTTYIYLGLVLSIYILSKIKGDVDKVLNSVMVFVLLGMTLSWYSFCASPLLSAGYVLSWMSSSFLSDILNPAARGAPALNPSQVQSYASVYNWVSTYAVHFLIAVGVLVLVFKPEKTKLESKYRMLLILAAIILFLCFALPNLAPTLNFARFYAITFLFLAPCFVLGGKTLFGLLEKMLRRARIQSSLDVDKQKSTVLLCVLLIGYFLSQSGFINCITGATPISYSLDNYRIRTSSDRNLQVDFHEVYITEPDATGVRWLSRNTKETPKIYSDYLSQIRVLCSVGLIPLEQVNVLFNETKLERGGFIYLGELNVVKGTMTKFLMVQYNTSEISGAFHSNNLVYSNGGCEIWQVHSTTYVSDYLID